MLQLKIKETFTDTVLLFTNLLVTNAEDTKCSNSVTNVYKLSVKNIQTV